MTTQRSRLAVLFGSVLLAGLLLLPTAARAGGTGNPPNCEQIGAKGAPPTSVHVLTAASIWVAAFTDSDLPGGDETISIDWGDAKQAQTTAGTLAHVGMFNSAVMGEHMYSHVGTFTVTATITDADAVPSTVTTSMQVAVR